MAKVNTPEESEQLASRLLEGRMEFVRAAIAARGALATAQEALKEAEKNDASAYQAAVSKGGWSEEELRKIGLNQPDKLKRVQRRQRRNQTPTQNNSGTESREEPAANDEQNTTDTRQNNAYIA